MKIDYNRCLYFQASKSSHFLKKVNYLFYYLSSISRGVKVAVAGMQQTLALSLGVVHLSRGKVSVMVLGFKPFPPQNNRGYEMWGQGS